VAGAVSSLSLGLDEALKLTLGTIKPLQTEEVPLVDSVGRVTASDLYALVDSPSINASLMDGFAMRSCDIAGASSVNPARLRLIGSLAAGGQTDNRIEPETAMKILTGAAIPIGADVVVPVEKTRQEGDYVLIEGPAKAGARILPRGRDVASGTCVLSSGREITPGLAGLLAAAGLSKVAVFKVPLVGMVATGDEVVEPGKPLREGKLYASNIMTLAGWCDRFGMKKSMAVARDDRDAVSEALKAMADKTDVLITSGGAWMGDRDMTADVLDSLGWKKVFHRIRIGPGKAVGFGTMNDKPVFILPGSPASNLMAFLQIALPGLLALCGNKEPGLRRINARLGSEIEGKEIDWTDFSYGKLEQGEGLPVFHPLAHKSRLSAIAEATGVAAIPEGQERIGEGEIVSVQVLG
jgi:molybdopterin molybdotransferase